MKPNKFYKNSPYSQSQRHRIYKRAMYTLFDSIIDGHGICLACDMALKEMRSIKRKVDSNDFYGDLFHEVYLFKPTDEDVAADPQSLECGYFKLTPKQRALALCFCIAMTKK